MTANTVADSAVRGARLPRGERRVQLLAAAQEVFVAQGYHAAAMDEIADRAGVSKPVLYQHFPGKLDLYLALLDSSADALVAAIQEALDSTQDNKQRVAATIQTYFDYVADPGGAFRLVFESDLTGEPAVRDRVDRLTHLCADAVSQTIAEDAGLSAPEAHLLAVGLTGMAQVSARYWLASSGAIPRDQATRLLAALSWRGIGGFPRQT